jgi:hypothetical protein
MATRSRHLKRSIDNYDVLAKVNPNEDRVVDGETIASDDESLLSFYCSIKEKGAFDGEKTVVNGDEINVNLYKVETLFDEELYAALQLESSTVEFGGYVSEVSNIVLKPSPARARTINFIATHGLTDFTRD